MTITPPKIDPAEFRLMQEYLEKKCGIHVVPEKTYLFETRLTALMVENGCKTFMDLHIKAVGDSSNTLRDKIIDAMTTNETLWFRDKSPFIILDDVLLKEFMAEVSAGKRSKIRIWSAASSTGQEPYSIGMTILEYFRKQGITRPPAVEIIASDISTTVLFLAKLGRYDGLAMARGMTDDIKGRYFIQSGKVWAINDQVKKMVEFKKFNLQESFSFLGKMDIVFCRNVMIYFSDAFKKDVLHRIGDLLKPNGSFFLGASESLINYSSEYQMLRHTEGLYYKVK